MKRFTLVAVAAMFAAGAAHAQSTTVIQRDSGSSKTIVEERNPTVIEKRSVETTGSVGCSTTTKQKTDAFGDTKTKQKTEC